MKNVKLLRRYVSAICLPVILSMVLSTPASANSAQSHWRGTTATGAIIADDNCPIVVEHELLTFHIQEFPENYYKEISDYLDYSGNVTATYTFSNPAAYSVNATLVFPFGKIPDYGHWRYMEADDKKLTSDTEKYQITADGVAMEKTLRHTLSFSGSQFELDRDMALLHDGYMSDSFYDPDMQVTRYTYMPHDVDLDTYDAANAAFVLSADPSTTKVLMENQNGGTLLKNQVQIEGWVSEAPFVVNVIGESLEQMPDWKFYENGACEKEINGTMTLTNTETTTLRELALSQYDRNSGVLEHDWYNAIIESMNSLEEHGVIPGSVFSFDISDQLMRWYEYDITLAPGETVVNTVTAPIYPSINTRYEPPIYEYTYLLSPAKSWAEFGTLDIVVNTPYHMIDSSIDGFEPIASGEEGFQRSLEGLPEGELNFTLCDAPDPNVPFNSSSHIPYIGLMAIIVIVVIIAFIWTQRKKRRM